MSWSVEDKSLILGWTTTQGLNIVEEKDSEMALLHNSCPLVYAYTTGAGSSWQSSYDAIKVDLCKVIEPTEVD